MNNQCQYVFERTLDDGRMQYKCSREECGHVRVSHYPPELLHRRCMAAKDPITKEPQSLTEQIYGHLNQLPDVTRSPEDLERIITICTTQCKLLGTGQWGEVKYEGCPRFSRPCNGGFDKWMKSLADAKTWCEQFGPEQGVFYETELIDADQ